MIFLTSKRSALLGLFLGGIVGGFLAKKFKLLIILNLCLLILVILIFETPLKRFFIREDFQSLLRGEREKWKTAGSIPMRCYGLPFYLDYIKKHPWRGIGFGRFNIKLNPETRNLALKAHLVHAHNVFINLALYLGIPGTAFFLFFLFFNFLCLIKGFSRAGPEIWLLTGFIIYFIAFWTRYQFDDSFRYATSALYYLNSGLGIGLGFRINSNRQAC